MIAYIIAARLCGVTLKTNSQQYSPSVPGTDEAAIIAILGYRSNEQMQQVVSTYKTMFGKDLIADLKSEISGGFEKLAVGLCMSSADFDAMNLHKAIAVSNSFLHFVIVFHWPIGTHYTSCYRLVIN